jgi:DNA-binding transcriptional ArsR family regulator
MSHAPARDPLDVLGNPQRRAIVELLADRPRSVREIAEDLPISRPAVSRHLRLLSEAGLVTDQQLGTRRLYRLDGGGAAHVAGYLGRVWGDALVRFGIFAANTSPTSAR